MCDSELHGSSIPGTFPFYCYYQRERTSQGSSFQQNYQQYVLIVNDNTQLITMINKVLPYSIAAAALTFYVYMTGQIGIAILLVLIAIVMVFVYFKQNLFLYMPVVQGMRKSPSENPFGLRHPSQHDLLSTDIALKTSDGVIIRGWHIKAHKPGRMLIYFHENAGNIGTRLYYVKNFIKLNCDVIMVAYRGYSDSESRASEEGLKLDSIAVMEYAMEYSKFNNNLPIYVLGRSLGGAVSIYLGSQQQYKKEIKGMILENTFTSISDMIDWLLPPLKYFKFLQRNYWASIERIGLITAPILFIKSMQDELVPPHQMHILMDAAKAPKREYRIQQGSHNASWTIEPRTYFTTILNFFKEVEDSKQHIQISLQD